MNFDNKVESFLKNMEQNTDDHFSIREVLEKYSYHWKWILLSVIIGLAAAYFYVDNTTSIYEAKTNVIIDNSDDNASSGGLSTFQDIGLFGGSKSTLDNEMGILLSISLMEKVVDELKLNISYFDNEKYANSEIYGKKVPFKINFFLSDSILKNWNTSFIIKTQSETKYLLMNEDEEILNEGSFGKSMSTKFGTLNITPSDNTQGYSSYSILVKIEPVEYIVHKYRHRIKIIEPENVSSTLIEVKLEDPVLQKAKDILNTLIDQYNKDAINYRSLITQKTDDFINSRIEDISLELSTADKGVEDYKTKNRLTDMGFETNLILTSNSQIDNKIVELSAQIRLVNDISNYIEENMDIPIPSNLGLKDGATNQNTTIYNSLIIERNRLLKNSSELNPTVVNLNEQLDALRSTILRSLNNLESSLKYSLNEAKLQESRLNAKKYKAPTQEREIQDIIRKQQIIETLYLFLLEKREENAIKLGAARPNAKVIDAANGNYHPIFPSPNKIFVIAFIISFFIPIGIIFTISILDVKVHTIEDVEKIIDATILGDIPKSKIKENKLVSSSDNDSLAEAFRILRTNLNYIVSGKKMNLGKTIFISSTIAGEGKTIIALNLASTLASINKKVLLIGADLRKPKFDQYVSLIKGKGLSHYLVDEETKVSEIIVNVEKYNFDLINSWEIPPNPSDLLLNGRFDDLLKIVREEYDFILIDTPPVSLVTDTMLMIDKADLLLYIIRANFIDKRLLSTPKRIYDNKRVKQMAVIVNSTNYKKTGYGYGYGYKN